MLLALDAGNSNITIGAFEGRKLLSQWRLRTVHEQTADEWGILLRNLFSPAGLDIEKIDGIIISSVVPPIDATLAAMTERYFHTEAMFVGPRTDLGLAIRYDNPNEVGADRLVNGVAGFNKYGGPCVVVRSRHHHQLRRRSRATPNIWAAPSPSASASPSMRSSARPRACRMVEFPPAQGRGGHQHRRQHAIGPVLRRHRHDRRHPRAHHREARARNQSHRHRRTGAA